MLKKLIPRASLLNKARFSFAHKLVEIEKQELFLDSENCILVNENDEEIGKSTKRDCHKIDINGNIKLHRAFSVFLFNNDGDMLMQKRSSHKITYPDFYTNSCCSHPIYNFESEREEQNALGIKCAAIRRLNFELGIQLSDVQVDSLEYLTRILYRDPGDGVYGEHEIDYILFLQKDLEIKPNPGEVNEILWLKRENLDDQIASLKFPLTPWFKLIYESGLLKIWWNNLSQLDTFKDHKKIHKMS